MQGQSQSPVAKLLRQQREPFVVPTGATIGVYKIENQQELERALKVRYVHDAAKLMRELEAPDAWLIYAKAEDGATTILAMSDAMQRALADASVH